MKNGLKLLAPIYSAHRMVEDYVQQAYLPAYKNYLALSRDNFTSAKELAAWRMDLMTKWSDVKIRNVRYQPFDEIFAGDKVQVQAELFVNGLRPEDISVEIYAVQWMCRAISLTAEQKPCSPRPRPVMAGLFMKGT